MGTHPDLTILINGSTLPDEKRLRCLEKNYPKHRPANNKATRSCKMLYETLREPLLASNGLRFA